MITTASKPKLPKFATWPVGAEALAQSVEGIEHLKNAKVTFSDYIVTRFVSHPETRQRPYPLVELDFSRRWSPEGEWRFRVSPVPTDRAPRIRGLVKEQLLQRMRTWVEKEHEPAANSTRPRLCFNSYYNEVEDRLEYAER